MQDHVTTHQAEEDARNDAILIWLNGRLVPKAQALVSVYDSGFMLGDGVWEGLRLYDGTWAFLAEHMDRLFEAAKAIDLDIGMTRKQVISALLETQSANAMTTDAHARLMVTRGIKTRPFQHPSLSRHGPPVAQPTGPDRHHHHGAFVPLPAAPDTPGHRAAYPRLADDPGSQAQLPFQAQLHPRLHRRRKGRRR